MARKRMIDPNFWTDEKLGMCHPMARMTFMGLISQADDEGRLNGHPALIKSQIFPYDSDITHEHVNEWLVQLESKGLIRRYRVGGQSYICLPNFLKHQTINRPSKSKLPAPPKEENSQKQGDFEEKEPSKKPLTENSLNAHKHVNESSLPKEKKRKEIEENRNQLTTEEEPENDVSWLDDSSSQSEDALQKIEYRFIQRRGLGVIPSASDMESMKSLLDDGFTVEEILEGIDFAFDNYKPKHKRDGIKRFAYCETVIRALREKRKGRVTGHATSGSYAGRYPQPNPENEIGNGYYDQFPGLFGN